MKAAEAKLPKQLVRAVLVLCALPLVLNLAGVDFSVTQYASLQTEMLGPVEDDPKLPPPQSVTPSPRELVKYVQGDFVQALLEWTAFCIALFTAVFAFTHYRVAHDVTTPIIGTAFFFSGMIDAFRMLAAAGLIETVSTQRDFIVFTWVVSRTFNVCILIAGTIPFLTQNADRDLLRRQRGVKFILLTGILFGIASYAIIHICAVVPLPGTIFPHRVVPRPWDSIPLVLYLFAGGIVFPRFHRVRPSMLSHGLIVSVVPHVLAQFYAAFGSEQLFDNGFNVSLYLKIIAYAVPLAGLLLDYTRAYQTELALKTSEEKLRVSRAVLQGLLPRSAPDVANFDLAGSSFPAEAIGGDYFDYVPMRDGCTGVVVADVSGHDVTASIVMAKTRAYLRALAESHSDVSPLITRLNGYLAGDVQNRWFVTMFFAMLDPQTGACLYAASGHEAYLLEANETVRTLEATGPPLGVLDEGTCACGPVTMLAQGDILLLLTDGIFEAHAPGGEQFGLDRVFATVQENRAKSASEIVRAVLETVSRFRAGGPQIDDATLVVVKRTPDETI
jgi:hypothetical protein